jgi:adenosine kinase
MMHFVREAIELKLDYMFDPAFNISHFTVDELELAIKNCKVLIGNDYEVEMIRRTVRWPENDFYSFERVVITTLGAKGSVVRQGEQEWSVSSAKPENVMDPTGAGDAYRAGFIAGYLRQMPLDVAARMGSVASVYSVETHGTQTYNFNMVQFGQRYKENFGMELKVNGNEG